MTRPIVAITMGDAAGVGPEIVIKALAHEEPYAICRPLVIGDAHRLRLAARVVGQTVGVHPLESPSSARFTSGGIDCLDLSLIPDDLPFGQLSAIAGDAAFRFLERAVSLAISGEVDAICTAPINKEALHLGGHRYPGHTEILAALTNTPEVSMMLSAPGLKVVHCTTHIGLLDAIARIDPPLVDRTIRRGHAALQQWGIASPRLAVCGINPHAGENGLFGRDEEATKIAPGVAAARAAGIDVVGPLPADTLFFRAIRGDFDLVVAMYHDQGHCPVKVLGLDAGVNITLGLPVVRTSVDHGTAFDIAGKGLADERSLLEALRQAAAFGRLAAGPA
jgi:4-phospho-D-threonate 3-dehydrogenase / 4-phospho-D-erythronate 3-dehydrogenase